MPGGKGSLNSDASNAKVPGLNATMLTVNFGVLVAPREEVLGMVHSAFEDEIAEQSS